MLHKLPTPLFWSIWLRNQLPTLIKFGVIGGVLAMSGLLPLMGSSQLLLLALAGLVGLAGLILFLQTPALGLVVLIATIVSPYNGPSGVNGTMALVALLVGLWVLDMLIRQRQIRLLASPTFVPLALLVLVSILAFGYGQLHWFRGGQAAPLGAQMGGLALVCLSAVLFLLVAHQVYQSHWLEKITWLFLLIFAIQVLSWLLPPLRNRTAWFYQSGTAGSLFWLWGVALSFSLGFFHPLLPSLGRVLLILLAMAGLYVGLGPMRAWNSGWTPALVAVVAILWAAKPRLALPATLVGLVLVAIKAQALVGAVMIGDNEYSLSTRLDAWQIVLQMAGANPLLGLGFANYNAYSPLFPIRGYAVNFNSHSQYIDLVAQTGYLGLSCFVWFFAQLGWRGWRQRHQMPVGFARAYTYAAIGGVAGTFVAAGLGDWVVPFFYNVGLTGFRASMLSWLFLGGLVALEAIHLHPTTQATAATQEVNHEPG